MKFGSDVPYTKTIKKQGEQSTTVHSSPGAKISAGGSPCGEVPKYSYI